MGFTSSLTKLRRHYRLWRAIYRHPVSAGGRLSAVFSWWRIRLASGLSPARHVAFRYIDDSLLVWPLSAPSVMKCAWYGLGEYEDMAFCLGLLRPGDLFCDVGANAGVYTVLAAAAVGCDVVAVEPVPVAFDNLMQNVHANHASARVDARRCGVGRSAGLLHFTTDEGSLNHVVAEPGPNTTQVEVQTLDAVLAGRVPVAIKIDVEGFEAEVLAGAARTLQHPQLQAVVVEVFDEHVARYGGRADDIGATLKAAGLSGPFWYDPVTRRLTPPGTAAGWHYNLIFVRDPEAVQARVTAAKRYRVRKITV